MTSQGSTFDTIKLDFEAWPQSEYVAFVKELRQKLTLLTTQCSDWYHGQHHASRWVTSARTIMVWLGAGGVLATAIAAGLRVYLAATKQHRPLRYLGHGHGFVNLLTILPAP